jgi:SMC interacting uncharacterized protein involved in chromosome segregation
MSLPELELQEKRKKRLEKFITEYCGLCRLYRVHIMSDPHAGSLFLNCEPMFMGDMGFQDRITNHVKELRDSI